MNNLICQTRVVNQARSCGTGRLAVLAALGLLVLVVSTACTGRASGAADHSGDSVFLLMAMVVFAFGMALLGSVGRLALAALDLAATMLKMLTALGLVLVLLLLAIALAVFAVGAGG